MKTIHKTEVKNGSGVGNGISPDELDAIVPGHTTISRDEDRWGGVNFRLRHYEQLECFVPPLRDFLIHVYRLPVLISRKIEGPQILGCAHVGDITLTSANIPSEWNWQGPMDNILFHIPDKYMIRIANQVFDKDVTNLQFKENILLQDPFLLNLIATLEKEACNPGKGETLLVESITNQICVHLLREHMTVKLIPRLCSGALSFRQARIVSDYIEESLNKPISINDIAATIQISPFHFSRQFKKYFGIPPHAYVLQQRLERAKALITRGNVPLKKIASISGFCDQAHLTRRFKSHFGMTPKVAQSCHEIGLSV